MLEVTLRRFDYRKDTERLFLYMMKEENQILFSHSFQIHNLAQFEHWLSEKFSRNMYHDFFMIEDGKENTIGFTFSYEFFEYDGHCKYTLCLFEQYQGKGYGAAAGIKMMNYLFQKYPLRRIFISVFAYNKTSLSNNQKGGFKEIAVLPEYRYCEGAYHDLHILSITREAFYGKCQKWFLRQIKTH